MAEEELLLPAAASPTPSDHKRKLDESSGELRESNADPDAADSTPPPSLESDAKRPRLEESSDDAAKANGHEEKSGDVTEEATVTADPPQQAALVDLTEDAVDEQRNGTNGETAHVEEPSVQDAAAKDGEETPQLVEEAQPVAEGDVVTSTRPEQGDSVPAEQEEGDAAAVKEDQGGDAVAEQQVKTDALVVEQQEKGDEQRDAVSSQQDGIPESDVITRRMDVPNNKVGVLIGKAGDTIRFLQYNSKAKIQITRDLEADPHAPSRPVEITGSLESISKAEKLINAVIAEADAGGSPSLVARGVATAPVVAAPEQIQIQVPNDKVGLIIGRMGETIKSLQAKSGACIQLIPQHPPKGDVSKERTVRVSGTMKQIDTAKEMINDVMNQLTARPSGGINHQTYHSYGQGGSQWGPRGSCPSQHSSYDYQQRGPYQSRNSQYPPTYGSYPQHMGPRGGFGHGWEQRPPPNMQGIPHGAGGYDYYGGHGGDAPAHHSARGPSPNPAMGGPPSQANYNYGHPHGSDYRHSAPYSHSASPQHGYGHGYEEPKYDNHAPTQHPYGGHGASQPYLQTGAQSGYGQQQQFSKPQAYTVPSQGPPPQSYVDPPIASQPAEAVYQAPAQPYGQNVPVQQPYPYASSAPTQQPYASYGSAPATDGYNQPPTPSTGGYPQQGGQPTTYGQPAPGYAQAAQAGYVQYPTAQQGYPEQPASYTGGYGYQGSQDPSYGGGPAPAYGAAPAAQQGYAQPALGAAAVTPATTQPQSIPQSGAYGKTVSPQPGYAPSDSSQMYAAPR